MANKLITDLPAATALNATDVFEKTNDPSGTPASQKITGLQIRSAVGNLTGTGTPVGSVTPAYIGQIYGDPDPVTPGLWVARGLTNADWTQLI